MRSTPPDSWPTWAVFVPIVAALAAAVTVALWWWRPAPQMGADEDVLQAVDALFTAITARDEQLLGGCEGQLSELRQSGKLPSQASDFLDGVIRGARQGHWESSARSLYEFMRAQRPPSAPENSTAARNRPRDTHLSFGNARRHRIDVAGIPQ